MFKTTLITTLPPFVVTSKGSKFGPVHAVVLPAYVVFTQIERDLEGIQLT